MKDIKTAARRRCGTAFEIAIRNCIRPAQKGEKRRVNISEADSRALYDFYREYVKDDSREAMGQIALSSRRAAGRSIAMSAVTFTLVLCVTMALLFKNAWAPIFALLAAVLAGYLYYVPRRTAQKLWANRRALPGGTREALEKMCLILASNPLFCAKKPIAFGLAAAVIVAGVRMIMALMQ